MLVSQTAETPTLEPGRTIPALRFALPSHHAFRATPFEILGSDPGDKFLHLQRVYPAAIDAGFSFRPRYVIGISAVADLLSELKLSWSSDPTAIFHTLKPERVLATTTGKHIERFITRASRELKGAPFLSLRGSARLDQYGTGGAGGSKFSSPLQNDLLSSFLAVLRSYFTPEAVQFRNLTKASEGMAIGIEPVIGSWHQHVTVIEPPPRSRSWEKATVITERGFGPYLSGTAVSDAPYPGVALVRGLSNDLVNSEDIGIGYTEVDGKLESTRSIDSDYGTVPGQLVSGIHSAISLLKKNDRDSAEHLSFPNRDSIYQGRDHECHVAAQRVLRAIAKLRENTGVPCYIEWGISAAAKLGGSLDLALLQYAEVPPLTNITDAETALLEEIISELRMRGVHGSFDDSSPVQYDLPEGKLLACAFGEVVGSLSAQVPLLVVVDSEEGINQLRSVQSSAPFILLANCNLFASFGSQHIVSALNNAVAIIPYRRDEDDTGLMGSIRSHLPGRMRIMGKTLGVVDLPAAARRYHSKGGYLHLDALFPELGISENDLPPFAIRNGAFRVISSELLRTKRYGGLAVFSVEA